MPYRRCGRSGLELPAISLGLWHNFGHDRPLDASRAIVRRAFDLGITHFDLANNYGPPYGSAEENFGRLLAADLRPYRDELVISTKAGYDMWPGPYGDRGSRKYLLASLDQSLGRMGLDYVDIFYSHRVDPDTPLEETMGALDAAVRAGQGALRRHLVVLAGEDGAGRRDPARARHAAADPPALVLDAQPLDRGGGPAPRARQPRRWLHHLLAARPGNAHGQVPRRDPCRFARIARRLALAEAPDRRGDRTRPRAERDRRDAAASRSRSSRWRGRCATLASRRPSSALRVSTSWRRTSPRSTASSSPRASLPRSTGMRSTAASTSGRGRAKPDD